MDRWICTLFNAHLHFIHTICIHNGVHSPVFRDLHSIPFQFEGPAEWNFRAKLPRSCACVCLSAHVQPPHFHIIMTCFILIPVVPDRYTSSVAVVFFYFCCFHDGCKMLSTHKTHTKCTRTKHTHKIYGIHFTPTNNFCFRCTPSHFAIHFELMQVWVMSWFAGFFFLFRFGVSWGNFKIKCTFHPFYYCSYILLLSADDDQKATNTNMVDERGEEAGRRVIMNPLLTSTKLNVQFTCTLHTRTRTLRVTPTQTNCKLHMCHFDGK